eukprot:COSAG01_NODE_46235_length_401_cov_38.251656_1_plen_94_part_01
MSNLLRRTPIQKKKKKNKNRRALRIKLQVPGPDAASRTVAAPRRQVLYPEALQRAHQTVRNLAFGRARNRGSVCVLVRPERVHSHGDTTNALVR